MPHRQDDENDEQLEESHKPFCPKCGSTDIRVSHTHSTLDFLLKSFALRPHRCRSCRKRFYKRAKAAVQMEDEAEIEEKEIKGS